MKQYHYDLTVKVAAPFASQGLQADALGVDCPLIRDHEDRLIIPGTLIAGMVRDVMIQMQERIRETPEAAGRVGGDESSLDEWFGQGSGDAVADGSGDIDNPFEPSRRRLVFRDLVYAGGAPAKPSTLTRIQIDPARGSVKQGALQVVEQAFGPGEEVDFEGEVYFLGSKEEAQALERALSVALELIPALGAFKSAGFGRVCGPIGLSNRREQDLVATEPPAIEVGQKPLVFELRFRDPFLVDSEVFGGNIHRGREIIPGSVIKGCLARLFELSGELDDLNDDLAKMVISHALPTLDQDDSAAARAIPLTAFFCDEKLYDLFDYHDLFAELPEAKNHIVKFQTDWKYEEYSIARSLFGWPEPPGYFVRTRTAISTGTGGPEKEKLFSQQMIEPGGLKWIFSIDPAGASEAGFQKVVSGLLAGLESIGSTMARARCDLARAGQTDPAVEDRDGVWRITLQTPAMLFRTSDCIRDAAGNEPSLKALYENYWRQIIGYHDWGGPAPEISGFRFFAAQAWDGGYRARRYSEDPDQYLPNVLTQPGSVFAFSLAGADLAAQRSFLASVCRHGLPVPMATGFHQPGHWKTCAYTPENGYARITADWRDADSLKGGRTHA